MSHHCLRRAISSSKHVHQRASILRGSCHRHSTSSSSILSSPFESFSREETTRAHSFYSNQQQVQPFHSTTLNKKSMSEYVLPSSMTSPPIKALVPPGECQFTPDFTSVTLLERVAVSETTNVLRFATPNETQPLNLSTCACILAKADLPKGDSVTETEPVIRPYTPISTNAQIGSFDLLIKNYGDMGRMSRHMAEMPVGSTMEFKHIGPNVKKQAPFPQKKIGMLVGGTGVAPMIQALHAILGDDDEAVEVHMLYGSRVSNDILGVEMLSNWQTLHPTKLTVTHILSNEPEGSDWDGPRGFIDRNLIAQHFPSPELGTDALIVVCGPPPMYNVFCGPRTEPEITGILGEMGYTSDQVYKF